MKALKVINIERTVLTNREKMAIVGGRACGCACCDSEGSTLNGDSITSANFCANNATLQNIFLEKK